MLCFDFLCSSISYIPTLRIRSFIEFRGISLWIGHGIVEMRVDEWRVGL